MTRNTGGVQRKRCPNCGDETEFVQFSTGEESTVVTTVDEVGNGILELRSCDCGTGVENVLTVDEQRSLQMETDQ